MKFVVEFVFGKMMSGWMDGRGEIGGFVCLVLYLVTDMMMMVRSIYLSMELEWNGKETCSEQ